MMDTSAQHAQSIIEQFSKQAPYFVRLPGHAEATQLLINAAGVTASADVLDIACGTGAVALQRRALPNMSRVLISRPR